MTRRQGMAEMWIEHAGCDFCGREKEVYRFEAHWLPVETHINKYGTRSLCRACVEGDMTWEMDRAVERLRQYEGAIEP